MRQYHVDFYTDRMLKLVTVAVPALYETNDLRYHNWDHVKNMVGYAIDLDIELSDMLLIAIGLHDVIYTVGAKDNESKSAMFAYKLLKNLAYTDGFAEQISSAILATTDHKTPCNDLGKFLCDLDLYGMAVENDFKRNNILLRDEYLHFTDDQYYKGQYKFLSNLLSRKHIFHIIPNKEQAENDLRRIVGNHLQTIELHHGNIL